MNQSMPRDERYRAAVAREREWIQVEVQGVLARARARVDALKAQGREVEVGAAVRAHMGGLVAAGRILPLGYAPEARLEIECEAADIVHAVRVEGPSPIVVAPAGAVPKVRGAWAQTIRGARAVQVVGAPLVT